MSAIIRDEVRPQGGRIPNYATFAAVALDHAALWEITYQQGQDTPYAARHRVTGHLLAASDVELLDHCLTVYEPPSPAREYTRRGRARADG